MLNAFLAFFDDAFHTIRSQIAVATAALFSGVGAVFGLLPDFLGLMSAATGSVLAVAVTWSTIKRTKEESRKADLEYEMLLEEQERNRQQDLLSKRSDQKH